MRYGNGPERVVALFDVSGGDLEETGMGREFLWIADGLFFVIDPDHVSHSKTGDATFNNVLAIMRDREKPGPKGAAMILDKADKVRFEEPVARWLCSGEGKLDLVDFLRESADVYAYLQRQGALALAAPYEAARCEKATLHVASPTGGPKENENGKGKYPRGVTPMRRASPAPRDAGDDRRADWPAGRVDRGLTMPDAQDLNQIEYRHHPTRDLSPVASSMSPQSRSSWHAQIRAWVRHPHDERLSESACYQVLPNGNAALAWRYRDERAAQRGRWQPRAALGLPRAGRVGQRPVPEGGGRPRPERAHGRPDRHATR